MTSAENELTSTNVAEWNAEVVEMMAMRKDQSRTLPVFYQDLVRRTGGRVLVLCSGLGVRAIQFARAGHPVTCIELSPAMISHTRRLLEKEEDSVRGLVEIRLVDVRRIPDTERFGLIFLEDWDFAQLLAQDDQLACLRSIHDALAPQGLAVIDVFSPPYKMTRDHTLSGEPVEMDVALPGGVLSRRVSTSEFDYLTQIETMHVLFEVYEAGTKIKEHSTTWKLRHTGLWEFELLLKVSGLLPILRCPDFAFDRPLSKQPAFDHGTDDFAYVLKKV
jgi:SAM-dependent methyltransferase